MDCRQVYKWFLYLLSLFSFVTAAVIQFYITHNFKVNCDQQFSNPSLIAGCCLLGSVLCCVGWRWSKSDDSLQRLSLMIGTISMGSGIAAIGASIGEINARPDLLKLCVDTLSTLDKNSLNALQYASLALLFLSIVVQPVFSPVDWVNYKREEQAEQGGEQAQYIGEREWGDRDMLISTKPLVFV